MPDKLPEVSNLKEFAFLLLAGVCAGFILYMWDRWVTPQLARAGVPVGA